MTDCPRCGFSQPDDQFCANCGVNMQAYQPAPKPVSQKLFSNPYLIGALVTVILASMVWYLQSRSPATPEMGENTITRDEDFEQQRQQELALAEEERLQKATERQQQRQQQVQNRLAQATAVKAQASTAQPQKAQLDTVETAKTPGPTQLQMRFYEVPQNVLDQIYEKGKEVSASPVSRTLMIANAAELTAILQGGKSVGGVKNWNATPGDVQTTNYTNLSDEPKAINYDWNLEVVVNRVSGDGLNYQFRGDLYLAEGDDNPSPVELPPETHQVPMKGAIVIVGFLPHQGLSEEAPIEVLRPPLDILGTPEFRSSDTEFLIVLTPK